jgi:hypothetical protein
MQLRIVIILLGIGCATFCKGQDTSITQKWHVGYWISEPYKMAWDKRLPPDSVYGHFPQVVSINHNGNCRFIGGEKNSFTAGMPIRKGKNSLTYRRFSLQADKGHLLFKTGQSIVRLIPYNKQKDGLYNSSGYLDHFFWQGRTKWQMDTMAIDSNIATIGITIKNGCFMDEKDTLLWRFICNGNLQKGSGPAPFYGISFIKVTDGKAHSQSYYVQFKEGAIHIFDKQNRLQYRLY